MPQVRHVVYPPPQEGLPYLSVLLTGEERVEAVQCASREEAENHKFAIVPYAASQIDEDQ